MIRAPYRRALYAIIFFLTILITVFVSFANSPTAKAEGPCAWVSDSQINCGTASYFADIDLSLSNNYKMIFHDKTDGQWQNKYLIINTSGDTAILLNNISGYDLTKPPEQQGGVSVDVIDNGKRNFRTGAVLNGNSAGNDDGFNTSELAAITIKPDGSFTRPDVSGTWYFMCGFLTTEGQKCFSGRGGTLKGPISADQAAKIAEWKNTLDSNINDSCTKDSGALGFVICPLITATNSAINGMIGTSGSGQGFLVELLTIKPLQTGDGIYNAWVGIRNVALGLYIVLFAVIIFGNGLSMDAYTIKRSLPRLAVGVLLTFGSFFILQTLVDLSNILGNAIPSFIANVSNNSNVSNFTITFNFAQGATFVILWLILVFVALGALIIGVAGLVARIIIIYALVLLAPVAFLAWVLPNTESMFKKWWSNLVRVLMMFPIVTGMLAIAIFVQGAVLNTSTNVNTGAGSAISSTTAQLAGALAPLIAIILIPKTFKWGGDLFAAAAGYAVGKATSGKQMGKDLGKSSMKDGAGARALDRIGTKRVPKLGEDDKPEIDPVTGKPKYERQARRGLSRIPGIGGLSETKSAIVRGQRAARIKNRSTEGIKDISTPDLKSIYTSMGSTARNGARGQAVIGELNKRRGEAIENYAKAVRDGRDPGRYRSEIDSIDKVIGGSEPGHTAADNTAAILQNIHNRNGVPVGADGKPSPSGSVPPPTIVPELRPAGPRANPAQRAWDNRSGSRGQSGAVNLSTSASPTPTAAPSSQTPPPYQASATQQTPPPYNGSAPAWQPAPPTAPPPSGGTPLNQGTTQNVTNNITQQVSTDRGANQTIIAPASPGQPTVVPTAIPDAKLQLAQMRQRGGSDGIAGIERKLDDLQSRIVREGRESANVKKLIRDMRLEANSSPDIADHERGQVNDIISNTEQQAGLPDSSSDLGTP